MSLILCACGAAEENAVPNDKRVPLITSNQKPIDTTYVDISLPEAVYNSDWTQVSGLSFNDINNLHAIDNFDTYKRYFIGETQDGIAEVTMQPVISSGKIFLFDIDHQLIAFDLETKEKIWSQKVILDKDTDNNPRGGGLATDSSAVYITTNSGLIVAYNSETGKQLWRVYNKVPFSAGPTLTHNTLFAIDRDNRLQVFDPKTGAPLWDYRALHATSAFGRVAAPSVYGAVLMAPFTSGELTAINVQTQKPVWGHSVAHRQMNYSGIQSHSFASEVIISRQTIYASTPSGICFAIQGKNGRTLWQQKIGTAKNMLSAGNALYILGTDAILYALHKVDGKVIWKRQLQQYEDPDTPEKIVSWTSPIMSNGKIILISNIGKAVMIDAENGSVLETNKDMPDTLIDPIIANGKLYIHAKNGYLYIYDTPKTPI